MSDTMGSDHQEPVTSVLTTLKNVRDAYDRVLKEKDVEHDKLHDDLDDKYAPIIASCLALYYETTRQAYDEGFSTDAINRKLTEHTHS